VFQTTSPFTRKLLLGGVLSVVVVCAGMGGAAAYLTRCDMRDYLDRATVATAQPQQRYLFACGYVWHSPDAGRRWNRINVSGLPLGTRDGVITSDKQPNVLYLGVMILSRSSVYCFDCAIKYQRPAIYVSTDGGRTWTFAYKFRRSLASVSGFLALYADPESEGHVWAVVKNGDEITYYASGTTGRFWKDSCTEYYFAGSGGCDLPDSVLDLQIAPTNGGSVGE
jgi:photosystem II stability/assembly factor-like uncharacterized protein